MNTNSSVSQNKKLTVVCRVEAGCLGPDGDDHIEGFCDYAQKKYESVESNCMIFEFLPRTDKSLPEIQYKLCNKMLSHDKAGRYLDIFNENIDALEDNVEESLVRLIDEYLGNN